MSSAVFDQEGERLLCPDESCIGVLNSELVCPECGAIGEAQHDDSGAREPSGVDLLYRSLCPDGACIGILGADGACKECGKVGPAATADPRLQSFRPEPGADSAKDAHVDLGRARDDEHDSSERPPEGEDTFSTNDEEPSDFAERRLCYDGSCIGVIGADGTCKECGLVA